ncbi:MAG: carboxypeptidase regulatory-like domain-containing protein [Terriglobia bacterium]
MKITKLFPLVTLAILGPVLMVPAPSRADSLYGSIRGTVTDPSGAVIPGATVTARDVTTGTNRVLKSQPDGSFEFLSLLAPATYTVTIEKSGFREYTTSNIHLNLNQTFVVKVTLRVGSSAQHVTVEAKTAQVDTTSMQLGTTITGKEIVNLPLNGRNWIQLQQLQTGVVAGSDRLGQGAGGTNFSTNGAETQQNAFYVNGVDTADVALNAAGIIPSPDALGEFRMITNTIDPEYGRNSGAILNAVIKNGTNQFHGDAFEFYRDTTLDARNFFLPSVSPFHQNEFGGTIGGPIWKNHMFFFFSYQGFRNVTPETSSDCNCSSPGVAPVFSTAERGGNFSTATGGAFPTVNPSTGASAISPFPLVGEDGSAYPAGTPYATLFPTGQIPQADLNPLAVKLMNQFVPPPNGPSNEYLFSPSVKGLEDQYITRIDESFGSKDALWGLWIWERNPTTETLPFFGATLPGFGEIDGEHDQEMALDWNHIFNSTTLNEARFGYFRFNFGAVFPQTPMDPTSYGFTGILPQTSVDTGLPYASLTGLFNLGFSIFGPQPRVENTYMFIDNFSKIAGRHTIKAGFTMERFETFNPFFSELNGDFTYSGAGPFSTGFPGADFLLGIPDSYLQESGAINNGRAREYYSYIQDQFKLRPRLTLTYGTGWDIETPYLNLFAGGEAVNAFRPGQQSTVFPTAPAGLLFPGDKGITSAGGPTTHLTDFAPRVGFAWSPGSSGKWSLRGGVGLYYNRTEEELALQNLTAPPFSNSSTGIADVGGQPNFAAPFTGYLPITNSSGVVVGATAGSIPNKFPFSPPAPGAKVNFGLYEPFSLNVLSPNFGVPMSENYNLTLERQLTNSMILSIGYVGNAAHHLDGAYEINPAGQFPGVNPGAAALGCTAFNLAVCDPGSFRYNPAIFGSVGQQVTDFNSNYNSLQVSVNKRFSRGLEFLVAYTWSRYFDYNSSFDNQAGLVYPGINPFDLTNMYGPSANDAPQRLVISYMYTLPFYHFIHHLRPLTDGWNLVGITTLQHGFPVPIYDTAFPSLTCNAAKTFYPCPARPSVAPGVPLNIGNPRNYTLAGGANYWFNPKAFTAPAPGTWGNASRDPFYGPGINNWDVSLLKDFHITESKYIEVRLEAYNLFNHTQFGPPVGDINSPQFGQILSIFPGSNIEPRILQLAGKFYF